MIETSLGLSLGVSTRRVLAASAAKAARLLHRSRLSRCSFTSTSCGSSAIHPGQHAAHVCKAGDDAGHGVFGTYLVFEIDKPVILRGD